MKVVFTKYSYITDYDQNDLENIHSYYDEPDCCVNDGISFYVSGINVYTFTEYLENK